VDWGGYEVYHPGVSQPLQQESRAVAKQAFEKLMDEKPARVGMLADLLASNGLALSSAAADLDAIDDFIAENIEEDPQRPGQPSPRWLSVFNDLGLFLGDLYIERRSGGRWAFMTGGRTNVNYQRAVVTEIPGYHRRYNVDFDDLLAHHGVRLLVGDRRRRRFLRYLLEGDVPDN
jgi:hypothetical protein